MESIISKPRQFTHFKIYYKPEDLDQDIVKLNSTLKNDISEQTVTIKERKTEIYKNVSCLKALALPSANYNMINKHLAKGYKLLLNSNSYSQIKRVFLISQSTFAHKKAIYLSGYSHYSTIFNKQYPIDQQVYNEILNNEILKKYTERFEHNTNSFSTFYEEEGVIKEKIEEFSESIEDSEFTFDVQLNMLDIVFDEDNIYPKYNELNKERPISIVPIWVNVIDTALLKTLTDILSKYMLDNQNFFIFTMNLTYFGRAYNYFTDEKKFKSKQFLRDKASEEIVRSYLAKVNIEKGYELIKEKRLDELIAVDDYIYSKDVMLLITLLLIKLTSGQVKRRSYNKAEIKDDNRIIVKLDIDEIEYNIERIDFENDYEINLVSFLSLVLYVNNEI
jgi:predicted class III extradiol MEMO1 family dioxygenase